MTARLCSPRRDACSAAIVAVERALVLVASITFHLLAAWLILFALPGLWSERREERPPRPEVIRFEGLEVAPLSDPAFEPPRSGAAGQSAPVDPILPPPAPAADEPKVGRPDEVIPLGPRARIKTPTIDKMPVPTGAVRAPELIKADPEPAATTPTGLTGETGSAPPSPGSEGARTIDPLKARYFIRVKAIIESQWRSPDEAGLRPGEALFWITIEPDGRISHIALKQSTGRPEYDRSFEQSIARANPLPPLPDVFGGRPTVAGLIFDPNKIQ